MGVPAFYRWLIEKYADVVAHVKEDKDGHITDPNPNGLEFDHLYLDMNGIIHPCFHPDSLMFPPTTFEEVFDNIYAYIDRLFSDADLIMLALATHEIHFSILREDVPTVKSEKPAPEEKVYTYIRWMKNLNTSELFLLTPIALAPESALQTTICKAAEHCLQNSTEESKVLNIRDRNQSALILPQQFQFVHVWILREYLELDMQVLDPFVFDIERIVDDFVFMCFFMGNDFLPHLPTLEIHECGIDLLMHVYKNEFKNLGGYLVDMERVNDQHAGYIKLKRVEKFILSVGSYEEKVFKKRTELTERKQRRMLAESRKNEVNEDSSGVCVADVQCTKVSPCVEQCETLDPQTSSDMEQLVENTKKLKDELKDIIRKSSDVWRDGVLSSDKVKLGSPGFKQRYYKEKFSVEDPKETETLRKEIVQKYTEGLCWVLLYYYSGVPSWDWYYSYHYGLFASEMKGLAQAKVKFQKGLPFRPFDQLMAVLPQRSAHALPEAYRELMISSDSSIAEFYPRDIEFDMDGKRFLWQGICKLPYIDQEKLLNTTRQLESKIEATEACRNVERSDHLFWKGSNSSAGVIWDYLGQHTEKTEDVLLTVDEEAIICRYFKLPATGLQVPRLLEGVQPPEKTVFENDIRDNPLWHEYRGHCPPVNRVQPQRNYRKPAPDESVTHKHAGTGWTGAGRGRGIISDLSGDGQSASSTSSRGWFKQHPAAAQGSNRNTTPASNMNRGMATLRVSPMTQANNSRRRTDYNQNNSFWPTSSAADSYPNRSWRPASYATAASHQRPSWRPATNSIPGSGAGNGNSPVFTPRGRERGHYRSQDPNRW